MKDIIIPSSEEIIELNNRLGYNVSNKGQIDFVVSKIKSLRITDNRKRDIAKIVSNLWFYLIVNHPFTDGNKRTATEVMRIFLDENNHELDMPPNGLTYISLKIANNDITYSKLEELVYIKLREKK